MKQEPIFPTFSLVLLALVLVSVLAVSFYA